MASSVPRISEGGLDLVLGLVLEESGPDPQRLIHTEEPVDISNLFHNRSDVK